MFIRFFLSPEGGGGDCSEGSRRGAYLMLIAIGFYYFFVLVFDCCGRVDFRRGKSGGGQVRATAVRGINRECAGERMGAIIPALMHRIPSELRS